MNLKTNNLNLQLQSGILNHIIQSCSR